MRTLLRRRDWPGRGGRVGLLAVLAALGLALGNVVVGFAETGAGYGSEPSVTVVSPDGGEVLSAGSSAEVVWGFSGNVGSTARIELLRDIDVVATIAETAPMGSGGTGAFTWIVPAVATGSSYRVRVASVETARAVDESSSAFTIEGATLRVTAPNGGESWRPRTTRRIAWETTGRRDVTVSVELERNGVRVSTIATEATTRAGQGGVRWVIPHDVTTGNTYRVRVTAKDDSGLTDTSDADFSLAR